MAEGWFGKEEYTTLRKEVESNMTELATLEKVCVGGVAAIFAWVVKSAHDYDGFEKLVWVIPILLPIFGTLKAKAIGVHLQILGEYLKRIELSQMPSGYPPGGWESFFEHHPLSERTIQTKRRWKALIWVTALVSLLGLTEAIMR